MNEEEEEEEEVGENKRKKWRRKRRKKDVFLQVFLEHIDWRPRTPWVVSRVRRWIYKLYLELVFYLVTIPRPSLAMY